MKKVKLKSRAEILAMIRNKEIDAYHVSDDGEVIHYGIKNEYGGTDFLTFWADDHNEEWGVVSHDKPISKKTYEKFKILFEER